MLAETNEFGQPIGPLVENWVPPLHPPRTVLMGYGCRLEPLDPAMHARPLFDAYATDSTGTLWTYLPNGPWPEYAPFHAWLAEIAPLNDPQMYAIVDATSGLPLGMAGYLRIAPAAGSIEVGYLSYAPALQRNRLATAAMVLMMENAFALGYRRYEWKCNALNQPSRNAAERLGFLFEGTFRQATVSKGRSRDTAWFSIIDGEWPTLQAAYRQWLAPENFDTAGSQRTALSVLTQAALALSR
ncbi:hypothetical protein IGB42_03265 [Andreprevotia sp. IGB-42]|uniref:GNAT family N-acetyltransferase n=1 Tax=Andreprevotia sp. IGB-42 TaxID=2497473 RepID=UPI001357FE4C|nr:GNAT family protein [Andreprevotia sp. IGB-42]KAF0812275.1 hypothetical protein IGB42_03265 [Andreprevotia sp. IGB-42]